MIHTTSCLIAVLTIASPVMLRPAAAQADYEVGLSGGRAFMVDLDDPDPSGSYSVTGTVERRQTAGFSLGVEAGLHEYLILRQDLAPDVTGWSSKLEDTRRAWRVTPFVRWGAGGSMVRVYGQAGLGLYVGHHSYFDQQREDGELVVDMQYASTDVGPGIHLGVGLEVFPGTFPLGLTLGVRSHAVFGGADGFNNGEVGIVYRWGKRSQPRP